MKLLYCNNCGSIFNLTYGEKTCGCGKTRGKYNDNLNAEYSGEDAIPIGFNNYTFATALNSQPDNGMGERFEAFIIPKKCDTCIKK